MTTHTIKITASLGQAIAAMLNTTDKHGARPDSVLSGVYVHILKPLDDDSNPRFRMVATDGRMLVERTQAIAATDWSTAPSVGPFKDETLTLTDPDNVDCGLLEDGVILSAECCKELGKVTKNADTLYHLVIEDDTKTSGALVSIRSTLDNPLTRDFRTIPGTFPAYKGALQWSAPDVSKSAPVCMINPYYFTCIAAALGLRVKETKHNSVPPLALVPNVAHKGMAVLKQMDARSACDLLGDFWSESSDYRALIMQVNIKD